MDRRAPRLLSIVVFLLLVVVLLWNPGNSCRAETTADGDVGVLREWVNSTAHISTDHGSIIVELVDQGAPITVGNFIELSDQNYYDNMRWHRIVDDFVIQTGDPNSRDNNPYNDGSGGSTKTIPLEINDSLTHEEGAIGMARSNEPDSASSQFYICDGPQNGLDGDYAVFGYVVEGIEVVRSIASVDVYGNTRPVLSQHPVDDVWLYSVRISHGFWNETELLPVGPTDTSVSGGNMSSAGSAAVILAVVVPLVLIPVAFVLFKRAKQQGKA
jgi:peptidyl-prolyl cis-trans isomerase B (cyclophilin B)